jgi:hypothetical protein
MTPPHNNLCIQLSTTAQVLSRYGFPFWADKLDAIRLKSASLSHEQMIAAVSALYGGFGTLMDLAVDPCTLPQGVSEESANQELLKAINGLYDHVKAACHS